MVKTQDYLSWGSDGTIESFDPFSSFMDPMNR